MESYCNVTQYRTKYPNMRFEDSVITDALETSAERMRLKVFVPREHYVTQTGTEFKIDYPIADWNMDSKVDIDDIEFFELSTEYEETDVKANIEAFRPKYGYIKTDTALPSTGNKLIIKYRTAKRENELMIKDLIRLNALMSNEYLFNNLSLEKLQDGITSWVINDQHITLDATSLELIKGSNKKEIIKLMNQLTPYYSKKTTIGYDRDVNTAATLSRGNIYFR